jgi:hypothetical protein
MASMYDDPRSAGGWSNGGGDSSAAYYRGEDMPDFGALDDLPY